MITVFFFFWCADWSDEKTCTYKEWVIIYANQVYYRMKISRIQCTNGYTRWRRNWRRYKQYKYEGVLVFIKSFSSRLRDFRRFCFVDDIVAAGDGGVCTFSQMYRQSLIICSIRMVFYILLYTHTLLYIILCVYYSIQFAFIQSLML